MMNKAISQESVVIVIKPEEIEAGRAEAIFRVVERYCKENNLSLESRSVVLDRSTLQRHYFGKGDEQLDRIGKKIVSSLSEDGFSVDADGRSLAMTVLNAHVDGYEGKHAVVIKASGENAIELINKIKGSTDPAKADPSTIRGQFSTGVPLSSYLRKLEPVRNVIHVSETKSEADFDVDNLWNNSTKLVDLKRE